MTISRGCPTQTLRGPSPPALQCNTETDSALEEGGFETSVPRHGEVRAALHYSISGGVCGTGSGAALSPARRDDMIERIHSAVTVTPPPTNLWALLAFRESCAAKS